LVSIVIGLLSAFTIYSLSYVLRETLRIISFDFGLYSNIVSEEDRDFYNLFFALISLIFGNSITLSFLFSRPQKLMSTRSLKRKRIVNEQIFLNFNFAYWLGKLGLMFGAFSMCCMAFPFSSSSRYIAVLLVLVLYLESFKTLNQVLRKKKWKFLTIHALVLFSLSFGMSKIDIVNYKAIDEMALEANPIVDLPNSFFYQERYGRYYPSVTFKILKNKNNKYTIRNEFNEEIQIHEISSEVNRVRSSVSREELKDFLEIKISADKHIKLNYIKQIEAQFFSSGQYSITYNVYNEDELTRSFKQTGFSKRITPDVLHFRPKDKSFYPPLPPSPIPYYPPFKDTLNVSVEKLIVVDSLIVPNEMLVRKFKNQFDKDRAVNFIISNETIYQDYIIALSAYFKAVHELREKEQTVFYEYRDYSAFSEEQRKLREKYPIRTIESYNK
jgi:hypothetical protein